MKINNKFIRTFAIFASLIMLTVIAVPVVAAQNVDDCEIHEFHSEIQYMDEEEKDEAIEKLLVDLEESVADFNEAYIEAAAESRVYGYGDEHIIESIEEYANRLFVYLAKLQLLGMNIETRIDATQNVPLTMKVDGDTIVLTASEGNPAKIIAAIAFLASLGIKIGKWAFKNWTAGRCLVFPFCWATTPDGRFGDLFCGHPNCVATTTSAFNRFGP